MFPSSNHSDIDSLGEALRTAVGTFVRATRSKSDSLPQSRAETLTSLERHGPQSMAALAALRSVSHQTVSRMISELEQAGLVERSPHPDDARSYVITITTSGHAALAADRVSRQHRISAAIGTALSAPERQTLELVPELLNRLSKDMTANG